ncbi:chromate transporter [Lapidilactobacillus luobeiensis]|uniref:chromate transporter n=1 Tax=Lapidilactobacillus luobeiensis TaxID=2950371 RepID=UPI0021C46826|nr:chromate transporter [Lapidilactobacillus luobeiensis]
MSKNWLLFKAYLLAGSLTFSGGMAMLPLIEQELCVKQQLIDRDTLYEYSTLAQTFPGVIALTNACFVGRKINGRSGMIAAGLGAILPAYLLMSLATVLYRFLPETGPILPALAAIRATSASFLFVAAFDLARHNLRDRQSAAIALLAFIATVFGLISAPYLIGLALVIGLLQAWHGQRQREVH